MVVERVAVEVVEAGGGYRGEEAVVAKGDVAAVACIETAGVASGGAAAEGDGEGIVDTVVVEMGEEGDQLEDWGCRWEDWEHRQIHSEAEEVWDEDAPWALDSNSASVSCCATPVSSPSAAAVCHGEVGRCRWAWVVRRKLDDAVEALCVGKSCDAACVVACQGAEVATSLP